MQVKQLNLWCCGRSREHRRKLTVGGGPPQRTTLNGAERDMPDELFECMKCGHRNPKGAAACEKCTWPFSRDAWKRTTYLPCRITLDTGCINAKGQDGDLNTLENWAKAGRVEFQRTDAMLKELKGPRRIQKASSLPRQPNLFTLGMSVLGGGDVLAGPEITEDVRRIIFPTARPLTENQQRDVETAKQGSGLVLAYVNTRPDSATSWPVPDSLLFDNRVSA